MGSKWSVKRIVAVSLLAALLVAGILLYNNFNKLVSEAVMMSFNSNIISDVYELKFEKLRVNVFKGDVRVVNVVVKPRAVPLKSYPYINSSLRVEAEGITLVDVQLWDLLRSRRLSLKEISLTKPAIHLTVSEAQPNLFPYRDSTETGNESTDIDTSEVSKRAFESFGLSQFRLEDAAFYVSNSFKQRETTIERFNIQLHNLLINQKPGENAITFNRVDLSIGKFQFTNKTGALRRASFGNFRIGIDSLKVDARLDTITYAVHDFTSGFNNLDIHTADSIFHLTVESFSSSYKDRNIKLGNVSFTPNISDQAMQDRSRYQHAEVSGKAGIIDIININFDSLIFHRSLLIDSIVIDNPELAVFKDKTKPIDSTRVPGYFGQQIAAAGMPLRIKQIALKNVQLVNVERKPDSTMAKVTLEGGKVQISNVTNLSKAAPMVIIADAHLSGKVHFNLRLDFSYTKPQFNFSGGIGKFGLAELNPVLRAYTPATISAGQAEVMEFSGTAGWTSASGSMRFLYHDLEVDLALKDQAKWKSSIIAFAANSIVHTSNPISEGVPPRVVKFQIERDMHKGFVNIIMKSLLNGVKETLIMSKENRAAHQSAKKKQKKKDA